MNMDLFPHQQKDFIDNLGEIMGDKDFRSFFEENFKDWSDIKAIIMLMKAYVLIDKYFSETVREKLTTEQIVEVLRFSMKNRDIRQALVKDMDDFIKGKKDLNFGDRIKQIGRLEN